LSSLLAPIIFKSTVADIEFLCRSEIKTLLNLLVEGDFV